MGTSYNADQLTYLRSRWSSKIINELVFALNEGLDIHTVLDATFTEKELLLDAGVLDLRGIDLSHQNLRGPWKTFGESRRRIGVALRYADLSGSNLRWTIMPWADLTGAILCQADLRNAELIYANLSYADLTDVDMRWAWLCKTKFSDAKITNDQLHSRRNLGQLDFDYYAYTFQ